MGTLVTCYVWSIVLVFEQGGGSQEGPMEQPLALVFCGKGNQFLYSVISVALHNLFKYQDE